MADNSQSLDHTTGVVPMTYQQNDEQPTTNEPLTIHRREFLRSLGKWSQAVIGGVIAGGAVLAVPPAEAGSWYNRGRGWHNHGGSWVNRQYGGGSSWINRPHGWANRGGSWVNRQHGGGWANHGGWHNRGGSWVNR